MSDKVRLAERLLDKLNSDERREILQKVKEKLKLKEGE